MNLLHSLIKKVLDFWSNIRIIKTTVPATPLLCMRTMAGHFIHRTQYIQLKPPLSFPEQITKLKSRGMVFEDERLAEEFLSSNNYYHINIYFHLLMDSPDHFPSGTNFSTVMALCANDRWFRNKLLSVLEPIEIRTQTQISYYLGHKYGSDAMYQDKIYKNARARDKNVARIIKKLEYRSKDPVIKHHKKQYGGRYPIWVALDNLSFSALSQFYSNLTVQDKKEIAKSSYNLDEVIFEQWLHAVSNLRNICAHHGHLYRRKYPIVPRIQKQAPYKKFISSGLFSFFIAIKLLVEEGTWIDFLNQINDYIIQFPTFVLRDYGFPDNWKD